MVSESEKIIKEIEKLNNYYEREISKEQKERDKQWKNNPLRLHFELKAKLSQHLTDCEDELKRWEELTLRYYDGFVEEIIEHLHNEIKKAKEKRK